MVMAKVKLKVSGGDDGGGKKPPAQVFKTQQEVDAANELAKQMALKRGLVSGEHTYVARKPGDPMPQFIDAATGKPYVEPAIKPKTWYVPQHVRREDIFTHEGNAWYVDPQTGDIVDIDMNVLNTPRFRISKEQVTKDANDRAVKLTVKKNQ
jgi:hypothetical protein